MPPAPPISLEPLSVLLLVLVAGIALAVLPYAHRSLRGDRRGRSTTLAIAAMLVSTAVLAVADAPWLIAAEESPHGLVAAPRVLARRTREVLGKLRRT